jgi:hypothetical protein
MKHYFAVSFFLIIVAGFSKVLAQEATPRETPSDICNEAHIRELDLRFEKRKISGSESSPWRRYKEILEKCPDSQFYNLIVEKVRILDEEYAEHDFYIAQYYFDMSLKPGGMGLNGARSRLREIVEHFPQYSRITEVRALLDVVTRLRADREAGEFRQEPATETD